MAIGGTKRDTGVLKLVHPGRYVEIHTEPVTAAQVMSKNPRHCITRPDFFKYPSIVVRPESVLQLGRVFYIVPDRTIRHQLHRVSPHRQSPSLQKRHASKHPNRHRHSKKQFQVDSSTEVSSKYQHQDLWKQQFPRKPLSKTSKDLVSDGHVEQQSKIEHRVKTTSKVHDHARRHKRAYSKATPRHQDYINRQSKKFQSLAKVTPLLQGSAVPNPRIGLTPKHGIVGQHGYRLKRQSLIKCSNETTTGDLYHGRVEQQSATYSWHEVTKKEDHSTTFKEHSVVSNETTAGYKYQGRLEQQSSTCSQHEVTKKEDPGKTFKEHSVVTNESITGGKYRGRIEQHSATNSRLEVTEKEEHSKTFKENSAVSNETTIGDHYRGRIAKHAATYSRHEMTKKEDHRKRLKEYLAVSNDTSHTTTRDEYQGRLEQQSAAYSRHEVTKKEHSNTFKEHSVVSNETTTGDKYRGRLEQHSATYSRHEVTKKEENSKWLKEHVAVSNESATRDQYHGQNERSSATYSCHDMTKKEEHSKWFKEHVAVGNETTTVDHYHGRIEQNSSTYSCYEGTKKEEHSKRLKEHSAVDQERPSHAKGIDIDDSSVGVGGGDGLESPTKQDKGWPNQLKSCLQKKDCDRRSRGLRVTFSFRKEGDEKPECGRSRFCC